jgi:hypothetical protein
VVSFALLGVRSLFGLVVVSLLHYMRYNFVVGLSFARLLALGRGGFGLSSVCVVRILYGYSFYQLD